MDVYSGATLNLNAGSSVSGSGTLQDQGVLGINSTQALAMPLLVQGTITGAGALTVSGSLTSSGGTFQGPGTVTVASVKVMTSPALPGQVSVDGTPRDDWGLFTDVPAGSHQVCFGAVPDYAAPSCQTVTVSAGQTTSVTGTYTASPGAAGLSGVGMVRVTTSPAVPSQISVDGVYADTWGLTWLEIGAGSHQVCFSDVEGFTTPACQTVAVSAGATTTVTGAFTARGYLKAVTSPPSPGTIFVDGIPRDDWGLYTDIPTGPHTVCFTPTTTTVATPTCQQADVTAAATTTLTANYAPADTTPPGPATALAATPSTSSVALSWTNPTDPDFAGVMIRRTPGNTPPTSPTDGTLVTTTDAATTFYTDTGLNAGTTYSYAVFAYDTTGNDATPATITTTTTTSSGPGPVTAFTATATTSSSVTLSWTNPTDPSFAGVMIRRTAGTTPPATSTDGTLVTDTNTTTTTYTDTGLDPNTTYSYAAFAHDTTPTYTTPATLTTTTATATSGACTETFTGAVSSDWATAGNWDGGLVPGPTDWACIPAAATNLPATITTNQTIDGITNDGALTINGALTLTDTTNTSTTTGTLTIGNGTLAGSGLLMVTGSLTTSSGGTFQGPGTVTVASGASWDVAGSTSVNGGGVVNDGTATIDATDTLNVGSGATVTNHGTLTMHSSAAVFGTNANAVFANTGTLVVSPGSIGTATFGGNLVVNSTGSIQLSSGTLDVYSGATLNLNAGSSVTGSGTLQDQGVLGINSTQALAMPLLVQGTITGAGALTVSGSLTSSGGTFQGPGTVTVASGASWDVAGSTSVTGGGVVNDGTATIDATETLSIGSGATVTNHGTFTLDASSEVDGAGSNAFFTNTGTVVVSPGSTGTATLRGGYLVVNSTGPIRISSGTLDVYSGATLNLNAGSSVSGSGTLQDQGVLGINSTQALAMPLLVQGTITGAGALTVSGSLTSSGGTFQGPGTVTVASGASWDVAGSTSVTGGGVVNDGTATIDATETLSIGSGATVTNHGTLTMYAASEVYGSGANAVFGNTGTLVVSPGSTGTATLRGGYLVVNSTGPIQISSGTLDVYSGATLNLNAGSSVSGSGTLQDQGVLGINSTQALAMPLLVQGTITGAGALTVSGSLTSSGGTFQGPGTVTVASGASWNLPASTSTSVTGGRVVNDGTATLNTSATLYIYGTTVTSNGTLTMYASSEVYGSGANSVFGNTGTLVVSPGSTGTATLSGYYGGLVVNSTGPIRISSGTLDVYSGATLNLNAGSSVSGSGTLQDQGVLGINSTQALGGPLAVQGGAVNLAAQAILTVPTLSSPSGTLQLAAANAGQYGQLDVSGSATISSLSLYLNTSYTPVCGTSVTALSAANVTGSWANVSGTSSLPSGATWQAATTATTAGADVYCSTSPSAPMVSGVSPAAGPVSGGTDVTVTGSGFEGATAVYFGGVAAASFVVDRPLRSGHRDIDRASSFDRARHLHGLSLELRAELAALLGHGLHPFGSRVPVQEPWYTSVTSSAEYGP